MEKHREVILDGTLEDQERRLKEWCGLRPDQPLSELEIPLDGGDED